MVRDPSLNLGHIFSQNKDNCQGLMPQTQDARENQHLPKKIHFRKNKIIENGH